MKPKHLSTTGGNGQKFIGASKAEAESILKDALSNGKIVSISDNGLTKAGNASYEIIIDTGKTGRADIFLDCRPHTPSVI